MVAQPIEEKYRFKSSNNDNFSLLSVDNLKYWHDRIPFESVSRIKSALSELDYLDNRKNKSGTIISLITRHRK